MQSGGEGQGRGMKGEGGIIGKKGREGARAQMSRGDTDADLQNMGGG